MRQTLKHKAYKSSISKKPDTQTSLLPTLSMVASVPWNSCFCVTVHLPRSLHTLPVFNSNTFTHASVSAASFTYASNAQAYMFYSCSCAASMLLHLILLIIHLNPSPNFLHPGHRNKFSTKALECIFHLFH